MRRSALSGGGGVHLRVQVSKTCCKLTLNRLQGKKRKGNENKVSSFHFNGNDGTIHLYRITSY